MSARRKRTSRALIGILTVTIALGAVFYVNNVRASRAAEKPVGQGGALAPAAGSPQAQQPAVVETSLPVSAAGPSAVAVAQTTPAQRPNPQAATPTTNPVASAAITAPPVAQPTSTDPIADAKAKLDAGKPIAARKILNDALVAGALPDARQRELKRTISEINDAVVFSKRNYPDDPWASVYTVKPGDLLAKIAKANNTTWELLCRVNGMSDPKKLRAGQTLKIVRGPMHAVVSKRDFTIDLYFGAPSGPGSMYLATYNVGLGKDDSTPAGTWRARRDHKLKNPKFWGAGDLPPMEGDDPANPLGEFWIGLEGIDGDAIDKESYGIHGTIEPDSIGRMASMGCIRLTNADVERVYELLIEEQSTIVVRE